MFANKHVLPCAELGAIQTGRLRLVLIGCALRDQVLDVKQTIEEKQGAAFPAASQVIIHQGKASPGVSAFSSIAASLHSCLT